MSHPVLKCIANDQIQIKELSKIMLQYPLFQAWILKEDVVLIYVYFIDAYKKIYLITGLFVENGYYFLWYLLR